MPGMGAQQVDFTLRALRGNPVPASEPIVEMGLRHRATIRQRCVLTEAGSFIRLESHHGVGIVERRKHAMAGPPPANQLDAELERRTGRADEVLRGDIMIDEKLREGSCGALAHTNHRPRRRRDDYYLRIRGHRCFGGERCQPPGKSRPYDQDDISRPVNGFSRASHVHPARIRDKSFAIRLTSIFR